MNMLAGVPNAACPYCTRSLGRWEDSRIIHRCAACRRPLGRIRTGRELAIYRVMPMLDLTKILGTAIAVLGMLLMLIDQSRMQAFVMLIAFALTIYGLTDISEGILARQTRLDRTGRKLRTGAQAQRLGWIKMAFGVATLSVAMMGIIVVPKITTIG